MNRTTEIAGMEILLRAVHVDLKIQGSPLSIIDRRPVWPQHARVGHHGNIRGKRIFISCHKGDEVRAANFFFPFKKAFDIDGQPACCLQIGFERLDMGEHLSLVITGTATEEIDTADGRLEGR